MKRRPNPKYLAFIRRQRCAACGCAPPCEAHHPRSGSRSGTALKCPDEDAIPLCATCHRGNYSVHSGGEGEWLEANGIELGELQGELRGRFER